MPERPRALPPGAPILAIDTALLRAVVALGTADGTLSRRLRWEAGHRHGEELLPRLKSLLAAHGIAARDRSAVSSLGPVPAPSPASGSASRRPRRSRTASACRSSGISTAAALLAAASVDARAGRPSRSLLPAGPSDRVLVRDGHGGAAAGRHGAGPPDLRRRPGGRRPARSGAPGDALARGERCGRRARRRRSSASAPTARPAATSTTGAPRARVRDAAARRDAASVGRWRGRTAPGEAFGSSRWRFGRPRRRPGDRAAQLPDAVAVARLPDRARDESPGDITSSHGSPAGSSATAACGSWSTRPTSPRSRSIPTSDAGGSASACCWRCSTLRDAPERARGDARGAAVESAGATALREIRLSARRTATALLQRRQRGRPDHDDRVARERRDARADRPAAGGARGARTGRRVQGPLVADADDADRPGRRSARLMAGPLILADRDELRRDRHRAVEGGRTIHSNVVASQVALHAASGGIVPGGRRAGAPALDRARARRGDRGRRRRLVGHRRRGRHEGPRASPARCSSGINFAKGLAFVHEKPLVGVNHLEGHLYAAWLQPPGRAPRHRSPEFPARRARSCRAVTRSSSRCATT